MKASVDSSFGKTLNSILDAELLKPLLQRLAVSMRLPSWLLMRLSALALLPRVLLRKLKPVSFLTCSSLPCLLLSRD